MQTFCMLSMAVYKGVQVSDNGISVKPRVKVKRKPSIKTRILNKFMFCIVYTSYCFISTLHSNYSHCLKPFRIHLYLKISFFLFFCDLLGQVKFVLFLQSPLSEAHCGHNCFKVRKYTKLKRRIE